MPQLIVLLPMYKWTASSRAAAAAKRRAMPNKGSTGLGKVRRNVRDHATEVVERDNNEDAPEHDDEYHHTVRHAVSTLSKHRHHMSPEGRKKFRQLVSRVRNGSVHSGSHWEINEIRRDIVKGRRKGH